MQDTIDVFGNILCASSFVASEKHHYNFNPLRPASRGRNRCRPPGTGERG